MYTAWRLFTLTQTGDFVLPTELGIVIDRRGLHFTLMKRQGKLFLMLLQIKGRKK
jgi:hypothetical protein